MEDSINPNNKHPNHCTSLQQAHADPPERPGRPIDGNPSISDLRLVNWLKTAVRRSVGWIFRWCQLRTAIRKLQALNDHYLMGIGLICSQIVSSVEEAIKMDTHLS